jgi:hypothetical protein
MIVRRFRGATRIKALIRSNGRPAASTGKGLVFIPIFENRMAGSEH